MILNSNWQDLPLAMRGRRLGEEYVFEADNPPLKFTLSRLYEDSRGTRSEILVESTQSGNEGELLRDYINLISLRSKISLAKLLAQRAKVPGQYDLMIELISGVSVDTMRAGEPLVYLMDTKEAARTEYLIDKLLPKGETTVFYGDGMSGKSLTSLAVAAAVASGIDLPGIKVRGGPRTVLYLDWETRPQTHVSYLRRLERGHEFLVPRDRLLYRSMSRSLVNDLSRVKLDADRHNVELVLIDSMIPACAGEPESAEVVMRFFNALRELQNTTHLANSHITKVQAGTKKLGRPFGSVFTTNLARSTWALTKNDFSAENLLETALHHTKINLGPLLPPVGFRYRFKLDSIHLSTFSPEEEPAYDETTPLRLRIAGVLRRGPMNTTEITEELGSDDSRTIRKTLRRMGSVVMVSPGGGRGKASIWALKSHQEEPDDIQF